jgi:Fur family transcriptional regulator, peroxide stress response regulator
MQTTLKIQVRKKSKEVRFKRTPQRLAILEFLKGNTSHPSAEDIYRAVGKKYESMSFATVYNTLHALTQAGALRELTIDPDRKRYDPDTSRHHHLICLACGKIFDVPDEIRVDLPRAMQEDFTIIGNHVEFYGHCSACGKTRNAA